MVIEPHILIPSATLAVMIMILAIRLVAGPRNAVLTEAGIRTFLTNEETGVTIQDILISKDQKYALIQLTDPIPLRLIRSFGDKYVMQGLEPEDLEFNAQKLKIARQDIAHGELDFVIPTQFLPESWSSLLKTADQQEVNA